MAHSRTFLVGLLAAILATGQAKAQRTPQSYFSPHGGGADATAAKIRDARSTIDFAMYSISTSGPIWEALQEAVADGVRVRCILNKGDSDNASKAAALEGIGVHVFTVEKTMHEKFALIDAPLWWRRKLINGSANWSRGAETKYSENTIVFNRHYGLFYAFQQEFNTLLSRSKPLSVGAADHMEPVKLRRPRSSVLRRERAVFTSSNTDGSYNCADEIIALMQTAKESIKIDVAHFNLRRIADALIQVHQDDLADGVEDIEIEVLVDIGEYGVGYSQVRHLEANGIPVRYKTYSLLFHHPRSQIMHHKTIIVDETNMITGSYNWSRTAEHKNYENIIVIEGSGPNEKLLEAFVAEHDRLWDGHRDLYPAVLAAYTAQPGEPAYRRVVPIHWDTDYFRGWMTLTRNEIAPLRAVGYANGLYGNDGASYLDKESGTVFYGTPPHDRFLGPGAPSPGSASGLSGALTGAYD